MLLELEDVMECLRLALAQPSIDKKLQHGGDSSRPHRPTGDMQTLILFECASASADSRQVHSFEQDCASVLRRVFGSSRVERVQPRPISSASDGNR